MRNRFAEKLQALNQNRNFHITLLTASVIALTISSLYVALRSAQINNYNIDQLVDGFLFSNGNVFHSAVFPSSHTFLLKWPIFALIAIAGSTSHVFIFATMAVYLATVLAFAAMIVYWTKSNFLVSAVLVLALTAILFIMPAQVRPGTQAPLNMAMVTTRNIEYIVYFYFIHLLITAKKVFSIRSLAAVIVIVLLGLTDHLFVILAGIAAVSHVGYQRFYVKKTLSLNTFHPLIITAIGYAGVIATSMAINLLSLTNIYQPTQSAPFTTTTSLWEGLTAITWTIQALIQNFGIDIFNKQPSITLLPHLVNFVIFTVAMIAVYKALINKSTIREFTHQKTNIYHFSYWLALTTLASLLIYVLSHHILEDDLRYVGIILFTGFCGLCMWLNKLTASVESININKYLLAAYAVLVLLLPLYALSAREGLHKDLKATQDAFNGRISASARIIQENKVTVFLGDYYVVSPVRLRTRNTIQITPLLDEGCLLPVNYLTSKAWYSPVPNANSVKSALLLRPDTDKSTFDHGCTMKFLRKKFGTHYKKVPLAKGNNESLLIYNYDIRKAL